MFAAFLSAAVAQTTASLPPNYKIVLDNNLVQVQRVHYGPHEFIPMHDHPAVATILVYLNDSGVVDIAHDGPNGEVIHRPPTHAGAFRIAPGAFERHSIQNQSDLPSDFFRIELKQLPGDALHGEFRGPAPTPPLAPGTTVAYDNPHLRIERFVCAASPPCKVTPEPYASVLIEVPNAEELARGMPLAQWLPAGKTTVSNPGRPAELLRIELPAP